MEGVNSVLQVLEGRLNVEEMTRREVKAKWSGTGDKQAAFWVWGSWSR